MHNFNKLHTACAFFTFFFYSTLIWYIKLEGTTWKIQNAIFSLFYFHPGVSRVMIEIYIIWVQKQDGDTIWILALSKLRKHKNWCTFFCVMLQMLLIPRVLGAQKSIWVILNMPCGRIPWCFNAMCPNLGVFPPFLKSRLHSS